MAVWRGPLSDSSGLVVAGAVPAPVSGASPKSTSANMYSSRSEPASAEKYNAPLKAIRNCGEDGPVVLMFATCEAVKVEVLYFQSSAPSAPPSAWKKSSPPNAARYCGEERRLELMSATRDAEVPLYFQSSAPFVPSSAWKYRTPPKTVRC